MKTIYAVSLLLLACGAHATPQPPPVDMSSPHPDKSTPATIAVESRDYRNNRGHALVAIYRSKAGFPDDGALAWKRERLPIVNGVVSHTFAQVPPGMYAIAILHDENDNLKMDTNVFGIPKEGYGVSNNVKGRWGPPSWKNAKFAVTSDQKVRIEITINYH